MGWYLLPEPLLEAHAGGVPNRGVDFGSLGGLVEDLLNLQRNNPIFRKEKILLVLYPP